MRQKGYWKGVEQSCHVCTEPLEGRREGQAEDRSFIKTRRKEVVEGISIGLGRSESQVMIIELGIVLWHGVSHSFFFSEKQKRAGSS